MSNPLHDLIAHDAAEAEATLDPNSLTDWLDERERLLQKADALERQLKDCRGTIRAIEESQLPTLLDNLGVGMARDAKGRRVMLEQVVTASLTNAATRGKAIAWLRAHGHDGIVTTDVVASFGKGEGMEAEAARNALQEIGVVPEVVENVNTTSFKAVVKELLEEGQAIPTDDIGVYIVRKAVIKK